MVITTLVDISYLIGAVLFVWGLRLLSSPDTARKGNLYAAFGMGVGIIGSLVDNRITGDGNYGWICLLYTSPSPRDLSTSRMPSSA